MSTPSDNNTFSLLKRFWKPFAVLFVLFYIVFNWSDISWLFNYKVAGQYISDFMPKNNGQTGDPAITDPGKQDTPADKKTDPKTDTTIDPVKPKTDPVQPADPTEKPVLKDQISIAKIGITAPIVSVSSTDNTVIHKYLDSGVVMYADSAMPGIVGQSIILGHSAPPGWPHIKFDWAFTKISQLKPGDVVKITYKSRVYSYSVKKTIFIDRGGALPNDDPDKSTLYLVSCWPPGKDYKRIAVETVLME